jgi:hypothetical protein
MGAVAAGLLNASDGDDSDEDEDGAERVGLGDLHEMGEIRDACDEKEATKGKESTGHTVLLAISS